MRVSAGISMEKLRSFRSTLTLLPLLAALLPPLLIPESARAANPILPPFPPGLFYPVDNGKAPTMPGATLVLVKPVFDLSGLPGWIQGRKITNSMKVTIPKFEMLVIRGSVIRQNTVVIPPGGLYFDASPARGELPMTGSSDYFLGKRYYFVDYDARIHVKKNASVRSAQMTIVGNHLYTMLLPPVAKVVPDPVVNWRTFDGVSIRPWAFSERWEKPSPGRPDQRPMTYLQGVIGHADKNGVTFTSLTGTSIHSEWWAKRLLFEGVAKAGQTFGTGDDAVVITRIDQDHSRVTLSFLHKGRRIASRTLVARNSPTLPENPVLRRKMTAIHDAMAVVLWPHDAVRRGSVHLWVYAGVEEWKTNKQNFGLTDMAYFPIACPIAHHIGGMIYNTRPLVLSPGTTTPLFGGYARIKVVSIRGSEVKFMLETKHGKTPVFSKTGNIDAVIGAGRAAHGILSTLDTTDLALDKDLSVTK